MEDHHSGHRQHPHGGSDRPWNHELHGPRPNGILNTKQILRERKTAQFGRSFCIFIAEVYHVEFAEFAEFLYLCSIFCIYGMKKTDALLQLGRQILCKLWELQRQRHLEPSATPIDIVIPIIRKDLDILPLCLQGVRKHVNQNVKNIYIVAPDDADIKAFCQHEQLVYIDETSVLQMAPKELGLVATRTDGTKVDRSGWLFQQLVKLSGNIGTCDYYLTIDADHILMQPHVFLTADDTPVFYMSDECNTAYYKNIHRLTKHHYWSLLSYVDHKMLFSKKELARVRSMIEQANDGKEWKKAILDSYDRMETSGFSEFELYGDFVTRKIKQPWRHLKLGYGSLASYEELSASYADQYMCITFPCYLKKSK